MAPWLPQKCSQGWHTQPISSSPPSQSGYPSQSLVGSKYLLRKWKKTFISVFQKSAYKIIVGRQTKKYQPSIRLFSEINGFQIVFANLIVYINLPKFYLMDAQVLGSPIYFWRQNSGFKVGSCRLSDQSKTRSDKRHWPTL